MRVDLDYLKTGKVIKNEYFPFKIIGEGTEFGDEEGFKAKDHLYRAVVASASSQIYEIQKSVNFNFI